MLSLLPGGVTEDGARRGKDSLVNHVAQGIQGGSALLLFGGVKDLPQPLG